MAASDDLAVMIVADGCLPMIEGREPSAPSPQGAPLSPQERAAAGFTGPGVTMRYGAADQDVIADYGAQIATIRLAETDVPKTLDKLDAALRRASGDIDMSEDPDIGGRLRVYMARLTANRYARITIRIPQAAKAPLDVCVAGVAAIGRRGGASP